MRVEKNYVDGFATICGTTDRRGDKRKHCRAVMRGKTRNAVHVEFVRSADDRADHQNNVSPSATTETDASIIRLARLCIHLSNNKHVQPT